MEISPENLETMAFLGQDPVKCKIFVHNSCLQQIERILNISVVKCHMKIKKIFNRH